MIENSKLVIFFIYKFNWFRKIKSLIAQKSIFYFECRLKATKQTMGQY